jgi:D-lactate dehydrogenase (cytochrome)
VRYGTMRENVLGLTVVIAEGDVIRTGGRARKSATGYDLTRLLVGTEGTLGIITELQLRLHGIPEAISAAVCSFDTLGGAVDTVIATIQCGIPVARMELLDEVQLRGCNRHSDLGYPELPTLFFELHGSPASVNEQAETVGDLARDNGGSGFQWARQAEERTRLWAARHDALWAAKELRPGAEARITGVCRSRGWPSASSRPAPISREPPPGAHRRPCGRRQLPRHLPDRPDKPGGSRRRRRRQRPHGRARARDGRHCTSEHGIGAGKLCFMEAEHANALSVMRRIKGALDPSDILNPGKVLPD